MDAREATEQRCSDGWAWCCFHDALRIPVASLVFILMMVALFLHCAVLPFLLGKRMRGGISAVLASLSIIKILQIVMEVVDFSYATNVLDSFGSITYVVYPCLTAAQVWARNAIFNALFAMELSEQVVTAAMAPLLWLLLQRNREKKSWKLVFLLPLLVFVCFGYSFVDHLRLNTSNENSCFYLYYEGAVTHSIFFMRLMLPYPVFIISAIAVVTSAIFVFRCSQKHRESNMKLLDSVCGDEGLRYRKGVFTLIFALLGSKLFLVFITFVNIVMNEAFGRLFYWTRDDRHQRDIYVSFKMIVDVLVVLRDVAMPLLYFYLWPTFRLAVTTSLPARCRHALQATPIDTLVTPTDKLATPTDKPAMPTSEMEAGEKVPPTDFVTPDDA